MTIYTGRGDKGQTDLRTMDRVSKDSRRIEAYGTVDEVNALVGVVRPTGYDDIDGHLRDVQNHLHIIQADLADPEVRPIIASIRALSSLNSCSRTISSIR